VDEAEDGLIAERLKSIQMAAAASLAEQLEPIQMAAAASLAEQLEPIQMAAAASLAEQLKPIQMAAAASLAEQLKPIQMAAARAVIEQFGSVGVDHVSWDDQFESVRAATAASLADELASRLPDDFTPDLGDLETPVPEVALPVGRRADVLRPDDARLVADWTVELLGWAMATFTVVTTAYLSAGPLAAADFFIALLGLMPKAPRPHE
jgi:hypothetical protein